MSKRRMILSLTLILFIQLMFISFIQAQDVNLDLGNGTGMPDGTASVHLTLNGGSASVSAVAIDIGFDTNILSNPNISSAVGANKQLISNVVSPGVLRIGVIPASPFTQGNLDAVIPDGLIATVTFDISPDAVPGSTTNFTNTPSASTSAGEPLATGGTDGTVTISSGQIEISLEPEWNLISLPKQPDNTGIASVLASIDGKYDSVWRYESNPGWRWYLADAPQVSNLWEMESGIGYWIKATEACSLTIQGIQPQTAILLISGWNLVGYSSQISEDIENCMSSIEGLYISVWEYDAVDGWQWYMSASPGSSNLDSMRPGYGYWIEALTARIWDIGEAAPLSPPSIPVTRERYIPSEKPDIPYIIWGNLEVDGVKITRSARNAPVVVLKMGDEVLSSYQLGAVSQHGDSYALGVPASVDDSGQVELYVQMDGVEVKAAPAPPGRPGQLVRFDLSVEFRPKVSQLHQNFPNPFNPDTWIPYQLKEDSHVEIRIYSLTGQLVRTLNLGRKLAGFYTDKTKAAYWDGKNEAGESVASGVYFYSIKAGDLTTTRKMVVAR